MQSIGSAIGLLGGGGFGSIGGSKGLPSILDDGFLGRFTKTRDSKAFDKDNPLAFLEAMNASKQVDKDNPLAGLPGVAIGAGASKIDKDNPLAGIIGDRPRKVERDRERDRDKRG